MNLVIFILASCTVFVASDHEMDNDESSPISLDYDTVTRIIEALKPENEDYTEANTEMVLEVTPEAGSTYDDVYTENPQDSLQKRKSGTYEGSRRNRKRIVISSHVIDDPEELDDEWNCLSAESDDAEDEVSETPCHERFESSHERSEESYGFVGSIRGTPGVDYPDYTEIPLTSFSCAGKKSGFYADVETRCQVFHVCYPHRRESFLCPVGTIFNQPIKACDYWYSAECSAYHEHLDVNEGSMEEITDEGSMEEIIDEGSMEDITDEGSMEELPVEAEQVLEIVKDVFPDEEYVEPEPVTEEPIQHQVTVEPVVIQIPVEIPQPVIPKKPVVIPVPIVAPIPKPVVKKPVIPVPVITVPKPIIKKPIVSVPVVIKKSVVPVPAKLMALKKFLPVKAKVIKLAAPVAKVAVAKAAVKIAKTLPVIKFKTVPVKAAVAKKVVMKPIVAKAVAKKVIMKPVIAKAVAKKVIMKPVIAKAAVKKILLGKAVKAKAAKVLVKKAAISALTKKHLALSLLRHKGHFMHGRVRRPVYYI